MFLIFLCQKRQLHKFIILTIIVPLRHDSVICLEKRLRRRPLFAGGERLERSLAAALSQVNALALARSELVGV